jgi:hypothetical protein
MRNVMSRPYHGCKISLVYQPMGRREQVTSGRECRRSVIFDLEGNFFENIAFVRFCEQFGQWEALQTCLPSVERLCVRVL